MDDALTKSIRHLPRRERKSLPEGAVADASDAILEPLYQASWKAEDEDDLSALTLTDVWCALGSTLFQIPAIRIPLEAVDAWWFGGEVVKEHGACQVG